MSEKEIKQTYTLKVLSVHRDQKHFASDCPSLKFSHHVHLPECRNHLREKNIYLLCMLRCVIFKL